MRDPDHRLNVDTSPNQKHQQIMLPKRASLLMGLLTCLLAVQLADSKQNHNKMRDPHHRLNVDTSPNQKHQQMEAQQHCQVCNEETSDGIACEKCDYLMCPGCIATYADMNNATCKVFRNTVKYPCPICRNQTIAPMEEPSAYMFVGLTVDRKIKVQSTSVKVSSHQDFDWLLAQIVAKGGVIFNSQDHDIKVLIASTDLVSDSRYLRSIASKTTSHMVDLDMKLEFALAQKMVFVSFNATRKFSNRTPQKQQNTPQRMHSIFISPKEDSTLASFLPSAMETTEGSPVLGPTELYNHIVFDLKKHNTTVKSKKTADVEVACFVRKLRDALWFAEHRHETLHVPVHFRNFPGPFMKLTHKSKTRPPIDVVKVTKLARDLENSTKYPFFCDGHWPAYMEYVRSLVHGFFQYAERATAQQARSAGNKRKTETVTAISETVHKIFREVKNTSGFACSSDYNKLRRKLNESSEYELVHVHDGYLGFTSTMSANARRIRRASFFQEGHLQVPRGCVAMLYALQQPGPISTRHYMWKVPACESDRDSSKQLALQAECQSHLKRFKSRLQIAELKNKFSRLVKMNAVIAETIITAFGFSVPVGDAQHARRLARVVDFVNTNEAHEAMQDILNAEQDHRSGTTRFNQFLAALRVVTARVLDTTASVRRTDTVATLSADAKSGEFVSLGDLRQRAIDELKTNHNASIATLHESAALPPVPCEEWIRLQFMAPNFFVATARRYKGNLELRRVIQSRTLRHEHVDAHYTNAQWRIIKEWIVYMHERCCHYQLDGCELIMVCSLDDKCKIPLGEPDMPVSTKVTRKITRGAITHASNDVLRLAADHDCTSKSSLTPSVCLVMTPKPAWSLANGGAWYDGELSVSLKDATFQRSSPFRHISEFSLKLLSKYTPLKSAQLASARKENTFDLARTLFKHSSTLPAVMILRTDGGSDHNCAFFQVQASLISLFCAAGLDLLVSVRNAPGHSVVNDCEKNMGLLNVALENVSTERTRMQPEQEELASRANCMTELRETATNNSGFKEAWLESTSHASQLIQRRFSKLKLNNRPVEIIQPASEDEIYSFHDVLTDVIDADYNHQLKTHKDKMKLSKMCSFMKRHCRVSTYMFVIRRCDDDDCLVCGHGRTPRSGGLFEDISVHDPPLPSMTANRTSYASFDTLKGKPSDETELPSRDIRKHDKAGIDERKQADKETKARLGKKIFIQENAVHYVRCSSCMAARLIYSAKPRATVQSQMSQLVGYVASVDYLCGDDVFGDNGPVEMNLKETFAVRQHLESGKIDGVARSYCNLPTQHAYFTRANFPTTCAWCDETSQDELLMESDHGASELSGKRCDPICKHCKFKRGMTLPLWGSQANGTGGRTIGRSGNGATSTRSGIDVATDASFGHIGRKRTASKLPCKQPKGDIARTPTGASKADVAAGGCSSASGSSIQSFFFKHKKDRGEEEHDTGGSRLKRHKTATATEHKHTQQTVSYLQSLALWSSDHNSVCEECNQGGDLVLCSYCNLAWHRACLEKSGLLQPETQCLLEDDDAHWPCSQCVSEAKRRHAAKTTFNLVGCANTSVCAMKRQRKPSSDGNGNASICKICNMRVSQKRCFSCKSRICTICDDWNQNINKTMHLECRQCRVGSQLDDSDQSYESDDDD